MRDILQILILTILITTAALAVPQVAPADSLPPQGTQRLYTMPEFIVSATRWEANVAQLPSSATVLTAADMLHSNGGTLAGVLGGVPGLFLKSYGGPGAVSTTSIRGMGAEQVLVLVDGQRFNNVRDGMVDFGIFPIENIERIEILRGGFSSIYGADAVGGIINIITHRPGSRTRARGEFSVGSFGMLGEQVAAEFRVGEHGFLVSARREAGDGTYSFNFRDGISSSILRRQNADYALNQVQMFADLSLNRDIGVRWSNTYSRSDRGSPGAVLSASSSNAARLRDAGFQSQATVDWNAAPSLKFRLSSLFSDQHRLYNDPAAGGSVTEQESDYADRTVILTPHVRYVISDWATLNVGGEYSSSAIVSDQLEHSRRTQYSLFLSTDHSVDFSRDIIHQINVYPSVRYDHFSGMPGSLSPRVGVNVGIWRPFGVRIKSSVGRSFHAPSFIDLYWKNSGNPSLQPERAVAFDVGVAASVLMGGRLDVEASYFNTRTKDRIAWVPQKDGLWKPKNLLEVESIGLELVAGYHLFNDDLIIRASYTNSDVRKSASAIAGDQTLNKQLPYLPHEMADVSLMFRLSPINVSIHHVFTGFRYITETNDAGFILSPFQKTDVSMSAGILNEPFKARLSMEVSNLFNTEYEIFPNYPMPLRTFGVRLSIDY